jgi:fatty acid kinase fatty acid binding subunit
LIIDRDTTALVVDSTADLPQELRNDPSITVVPLRVQFGQESYLDWVEIQPPEFFEKLQAADELPTTSQPSPGTWLETYARLRERYERVYSIHMNSDYGGSFTTGCIASKELDGVKVIDSESVSGGEALLVARLLAKLDAGTPEEEFEAYIDYFRDHRTFYVLIKDLSYAYRGGRLGRASYYVGNALGVKPIISIEASGTEVFRRARGEHAALRAIRDGFLERTQAGKDVYATLAHALNPVWLEELRELILGTDRTVNLQPTCVVGSVIGVHSGPGTAGIAFIQE